MDYQDAAVADARRAERFSAGGGAFSGAARGVSRFPARTSLQLGAFPSAVPCARLHARQVLWEWGLDAITETAELLVSELVTNGVKAAQATDHKPPVQLRLSGNRACLLIEIWDGNTQPPVPRELENDASALEAQGGRGLFLVEALSERWGWYPTRNPEGKVTWCEICPE